MSNKLFYFIVFVGFIFAHKAYISFIYVRITREKIMDFLSYDESILFIDLIHQISQSERKRVCIGDVEKIIFELQKEGFIQIFEHPMPISPRDHRLYLIKVNLERSTVTT